MTARDPVGAMYSPWPGFHSEMALEKMQKGKAGLSDNF